MLEITNRAALEDMKLLEELVIVAAAIVWDHRNGRVDPDKFNVLADKLLPFRVVMEIRR